MTKTKELAEISVLTEDQIKALPASVKKNVLALTKNMRDSELVVLNPLVGRLLDLRTEVSNLTIEKDEEGNITSESIEEYKRIKSDQRSFNGDVSREFKSMKKPYREVQKGLVAVEKTFKDISNEAKEQAEEVFAEYEAEKAKKAEEAQAKKDAEMNAKINEANEEAEKIKKLAESSEVYNKIRYDIIKGKLGEEIFEAIENHNIDYLSRLKATIAQQSFEDVVPENVGVLLDEVRKELEDAYYERKAWAIEKLDNKIEAYEEDLKKQAAEMQAAPDSAYQIPQVPQQEVPVHFTNDEEFIEKILTQIEIIKFNVGRRIEEGSENAILKEIYSKLNLIIA